MYWPKVDEKKREEIKSLRNGILAPMYRSGVVKPTLDKGDFLEKPYEKIEEGIENENPYHE